MGLSSCLDIHWLKREFEDNNAALSFSPLVLRPLILVILPLYDSANEKEVLKLHTAMLQVLKFPKGSMCKAYIRGSSSGVSPIALQKKIVKIAPSSLLLFGDDLHFKLQIPIWRIQHPTDLLQYPINKKQAYKELLVINSWLSKIY